MTVAELVFFIFATLAIVGALGTVLVPNVVHAALFLILALLGVAAFYLLLSNEFLALVQILIYGGAVATIILFGIMLTRGRDLMPVTIDGPQKPLGALAALALAVVLGYAVADSEWPRDAGEVTVVGIQALGESLFSNWALPFEIASVVLLVALIGAIVISKQEEEEA